jgi:hypothetical protein
VRASPCRFSVSRPGARLLEQEQVQLAAVDRVLRPSVAGRQLARLGPDRLAALAEVGQLGGLDADPLEPRGQPERGQDADRVRQDVDPDPERPHVRDRLEDERLDAGPLEAERGRQPADPTAGDQDPHRASSAAQASSAAATSASCPA